MRSCFSCASIQIQVSYYPPGQYPSSGQQYRVPQPMSHQVSYPAQRTQPMPQPTQQSGRYIVLCFTSAIHCMNPCIAWVIGHSVWMSFVKAAAPTLSAFPADSVAAGMKNRANISYSPGAETWYSFSGVYLQYSGASVFELNLFLKAVCELKSLKTETIFPIGINVK